MYKRDAKKLAHELGLKDSKDAGYGVINGFGVTISDVLNGRALNLYVGAPEGAWPDIEAALTKPKRKYAIRSIESDPKGGTVEIIFQATIDMNKRIKAFIETELPLIAELGFSGASRCAYCGDRVKRAETIWALAKPDNVALPMHEACCYDYEREIGQREYARAAEPSGGPLASIGALLGGLVGTIPFILLYMVGYFASITGFVIGLGANYGHKLLGGKPGKGRMRMVIIVSIIMVPVALIAGELASFAWSIMDGSLAESIGAASDALTLSDTFPMIRMLWEMPEARAEMIKTLIPNLFMSYIFAGMGIFWLFFRLQHENRTSRTRLVRL